MEKRRLSLSRQIVGGIGWTIMLLAIASFAGLIVFTDMHRAVYERVPVKNFLAVALIALVGFGIVVASRRSGRQY